MAYFEDIKTASQLKGFVQNDNNSHYFDRSTMRFFGDTMRNYGIKHHNKGTNNHCIELYRRNPVKHGLQSSHYFKLKAGTNCTAVLESNPKL